jgi:hypothetical protein
LPFHLHLIVRDSFYLPPLQFVSELNFLRLGVIRCDDPCDGAGRGYDHRAEIEIFQRYFRHWHLRNR